MRVRDMEQRQSFGIVGSAGKVHFVCGRFCARVMACGVKRDRKKENGTGGSM